MTVGGEWRGGREKRDENKCESLTLKGNGGGGGGALRNIQRNKRPEDKSVRVIYRLVSV